MLTALVVTAVLLVAALACEGVRACCVRMLAQPLIAQAPGTPPLLETVDAADYREPVGHADLRR